MRVLFVSCYVNNAHFISQTKKTLDSFLINSTYEYICLNDAPDIKSGEENYIQICDMLTGEFNCYERIYEEATKYRFQHMKIPQTIHIKNRPNHSAQRHRENFNWFHQNIRSLVPNLDSFDFLCYIDSDAFLRESIDLNIELKDIDIAGPMIYNNTISPPLFYPHTGLFFINLKTVLNMNEITWDDTLGMDTGSNIAYFIRKNPQYKIKELGVYDGYSVNNFIVNNHTIISLNIEDFDQTYQLIDIWFDKKFVHFRSGSCFGVGSQQHRNNNRLFYYNKKMEAFMKLF
jgi:hypothetical protein